MPFTHTAAVIDDVVSEIEYFIVHPQSPGRVEIFLRRSQKQPDGSLQRLDLRHITISGARLDTLMAEAPDSTKTLYGYLKQRLYNELIAMGELGAGVVT